MHSMKNLKLQWKDTPRPAPLGDPVTTSEYSLPDPFYQGGEEPGQHSGLGRQRVGTPGRPPLQTCTHLRAYRRRENGVSPNRTRRQAGRRRIDARFDQRGRKHPQVIGAKRTRPLLNTFSSNWPKLAVDPHSKSLIPVNALEMTGTAEGTREPHDNRRHITIRRHLNHLPDGNGCRHTAHSKHADRGLHPPNTRVYNRPRMIQLSPDRAAPALARLALPVWPGKVMPKGYLRLCGARVSHVVAVVPAYGAPPRARGSSWVGQFSWE